MVGRFPGKVGTGTVVTVGFGDSVSASVSGRLEDVSVLLLELVDASCSGVEIDSFGG